MFHFKLLNIEDWMLGLFQDLWLEQTCVCVCKCACRYQCVSDVHWKKDAWQKLGPSPLQSGQLVWLSVQTQLWEVTGLMLLKSSICLLLDKLFNFSIAQFSHLKHSCHREIVRSVSMKINLEINSSFKASYLLLIGYPPSVISFSTHPSPSQTVRKSMEGEDIEN